MEVGHCMVLRKGKGETHTTPSDSSSKILRFKASHKGWANHTLYPLCKFQSRHSVMSSPCCHLSISRVSVQSNETRRRQRQVVRENAAKQNLKKLRNVLASGRPTLRYLRRLFSWRFLQQHRSLISQAGFSQTFPGDGSCQKETWSYKQFRFLAGLQIWSRNLLNCIGVTTQWFSSLAWGQTSCRQSSSQSLQETLEQSWPGSILRFGNTASSNAKAKTRVHCTLACSTWHLFCRFLSGVCPQNVVDDSCFFCWRGFMISI